MTTVNIREAKEHLSRLVDEVSAGKELVIAKAGKPLAKLVPIRPAKAVRKPGFLKGKVRIPRDFDAPLPDDVLDALEGRA
jgi:prevent-host-death family protein